jgi:hypothetical protein
MNFGHFVQSPTDANNSPRPIWPLGHSKWWRWILSITEIFFYELLFFTIVKMKLFQKQPCLCGLGPWAASFSLTVTWSEAVGAELPLTCDSDREQGQQLLPVIG